MSYESNWGYYQSSNEDELLCSMNTKTLPAQQASTMSFTGGGDGENSRSSEASSRYTIECKLSDLLKESVITDKVTSHGLISTTTSDYEEISGNLICATLIENFTRTHDSTTDRILLVAPVEGSHPPSILHILLQQSTATEGYSSTKDLPRPVTNAEFKTQTAKQLSLISSQIGLTAVPIPSGDQHLSSLDHNYPQSSDTKKTLSANVQIAAEECSDKKSYCYSTISGRGCDESDSDSDELNDSDGDSESVLSNSTKNSFDLFADLTSNNIDNRGANNHKNAVKHSAEVKKKNNSIKSNALGSITNPLRGKIPKQIKIMSSNSSNELASTKESARRTLARVEPVQDLHVGNDAKQSEPSDSLDEMNLRSFLPSCISFAARHHLLQSGGYHAFSTEDCTNRGVVAKTINPGNDFTSIMPNNIGDGRNRLLQVCDIQNCTISSTGLCHFTVKVDCYKMLGLLQTDDSVFNLGSTECDKSSHGKNPADSSNCTECRQNQVGNRSEDNEYVFIPLLQSVKLCECFKYTAIAFPEDDGGLSYSTSIRNDASDSQRKKINDMPTSLLLTRLDCINRSRGYNGYVPSTWTEFQQYWKFAYGIAPIIKNKTVSSNLTGTQDLYNQSKSARLARIRMLSDGLERIVPAAAVARAVVHLPARTPHLASHIIHELCSQLQSATHLFESVSIMNVKDRNLKRNNRDDGENTVQTKRISPFVRASDLRKAKDP